MIYFHVTIMVLSVLVCYKLGDWRNWNKYYSTILFFIMGDYIYNILFHDNMLWLYVAPELNHTIINMLIGIFVFSSTVMVFIPYYPKGVFKQVGYILLWVFIYITVEYIAWRLGSFTYDNGWNLLWSTVFCIVMFPLLQLHHKNPLLAWGVTLTELIIYIIIFNVDVLGLI